MKKNENMVELNPDVLKRLQETQIEILEEIVRICEKHNLRYFLIYGTLIGAIRHKGFIPWDDDLDIGMPRDDYEKFMKVAREELKAEYFLQNTDTEPQYWLPFGKVRKNNTIFEEPSLSEMPKEIHKGIFVDIFPFDYVRKNGGQLVHLQFILSKAINETMYYKAGVYTKKQHLKYRTLDSLLNLFSMRMLCKMQGKISSLQRTKGSHYLADFNSSRKYLDAIYPLNYFLPNDETEFAGRKFRIPRDYDSYLKMVYGDYMIIPKEEDRVNHRTLRIVFDTTKE